MQNFKNLKVYGEAFSLSKELYLFYDDNKASLRTKEQLLSSASSICANLAEMAGFESKGQMRQKVITCIAEANDTEFWLNLTHELKILPQREHLDFMNRLVKVRSMLFNMKKSMEEE
ncbi:four helix bundle protein [Candidatus Micrarchaeota archaeon]|nr:four helix bundle protein [Candidatus Micrarchaeota archaeon]MBD3418098.1 four helix bundle protein [Candidatus Micrarchaeota archaeon]